MMPSINDVPYWYLILAIALSAYQGYRGFKFQWIFAKEKKNQESAAATDQQKEQITWTLPQKISLLCIADMFFYLITTLLGFIALFLSYNVLSQIQSLTEAGAGLSALLIFFIVFGVLGVSGQLPYLIQQGKFPWKQ